MSRSRCVVLSLVALCGLSSVAVEATAGSTESPAKLPPRLPALIKVSGLEVRMSDLRKPVVPKPAPPSGPRTLVVDLVVSDVAFGVDASDPKRGTVERFRFQGTDREGGRTRTRRFTFTAGRGDEAAIVRTLSRCAHLVTTSRGRTVMFDVGFTNPYVNEPELFFDLQRNPVLWFTCTPL